MAKITTFCNQKGGVGKTTTCASVGMGIAMQGKRVLLVDADPNDGGLTYFLTQTNGEGIQHTLSSLMDNHMRGNRGAPVPVSTYEENGYKLDYIPSNKGLSDTQARLYRVDERERFTVLKDMLDGLCDDYDHILIDCMPSLELLTIVSLATADSVIIPAEPTPLGTKGMLGLFQTLTEVQARFNPALGIEGVVITRFRNLPLHRSVESQLRHALGRMKRPIRLFDTRIPENIKLSEVSNAGMSIYAYDRRGRGTKAYRELTKEVLQGEGRIKARSRECR